MSKASDFWKALATVEQLESKKVNILQSCSDIVCFINPSCPDSQNLSEKLTKYCIYHNKMTKFNLSLHLVDVDGLFEDGKNGQLLLYNENGFQQDTDDNLNKLRFPMWQNYGNNYIDSAFSKDGQPYYIPQMVLWSATTKRMLGAWYQHHHFDTTNGHALRLTCTNPDCKFCLRAY